LQENERIREQDVVGLIEEENEPEEAKRMGRGVVHLRNLKDECPIRPVKNQPSRYEDIILFLHENRTPKQYTLRGDEDHKELALAKSYQN
jgi:hypothetical protein